MQRFNLELDNDIKSITKMDKKVKKPKIIEKGTFGEDGWSISVGDVKDGDSWDKNTRDPQINVNTYIFIHYQN